MRFNPTSHTYSLAGLRVPHVTELLKAGGVIPSAWWWTDEARDRGLAVHADCLAVDRGGSTAVPAARMGYLLAYGRCLEAVRPIWQVCEEPRVHPALRFGGTVDRIGWFHGPAVVELKAGAWMKWHGVQLALYDILWDDVPTGTRARIGLYLSQHGRYAVRRFEDLADYDVAFSLLRTQHAPPPERSETDPETDRRED